MRSRLQCVISKGNWLLGMRDGNEWIIHAHKGFAGKSSLSHAKRGLFRIVTVRDSPTISYFAIAAIVIPDSVIPKRNAWATLTNVARYLRPTLHLHIDQYSTQTRFQFARDCIENFVAWNSLENRGWCFRWVAIGSRSWGLIQTKWKDILWKTSAGKLSWISVGPSYHSTLNRI